MFHNDSSCHCISSSLVPPVTRAMVDHAMMSFKILQFFKPTRKKPSGPTWKMPENPPNLLRWFFHIFPLHPLWIWVNKPWCLGHRRWRQHSRSPRRCFQLHLEGWWCRAGLLGGLGTNKRLANVEQLQNFKTSDRQKNHILLKQW